MLVQHACSIFKTNVKIKRYNQTLQALIDFEKVIKYKVTFKWHREKVLQKYLFGYTFFFDLQSNYIHPMF